MDACQGAARKGGGVSEFVMKPVARLRSCYPEKFGVPRQSGLVAAARGTVVFEPECRRDEAVRGLDGFSHLWLVWVFDQVPEGGERLSVRPPRLGGNEKLGVFATRSPFRPNRIGMSVVKLERVVTGGEEGPVLEVSGVDLVDGTAILDVKPYVPYADAVPGAEGAFAAEAPEQLPVVVADGAREAFDGLAVSLRELILQTLALDARPAYHDEERVYHLCVEGVEVDWVVDERGCCVLAVRERGGG